MKFDPLDSSSLGTLPETSTHHIDFDGFCDSRNPFCPMKKFLFWVEIGIINGLFIFIHF